jgi:phage-related tail protein
VVHKARRAVRKAARYVHDSVKKVKRYVKRTYKRVKRYVHKVVHHVKKTVRKVAKAVKHVASKAVKAAKKAVKKVGRAVKKAAKASANFVKQHAATIASVATGVVVFAGCTAGSFGVGAVGCAAIAGAAANAVGYMMSDGPKSVGVLQARHPTLHLFADPHEIRSRGRTDAAQVQPDRIQTVVDPVEGVSLP